MKILSKLLSQARKEPEKLEDLIRGSCGNCIFFKTEKCRYSHERDLIQYGDNPCQDGLIVLPFGSDVIIKRGEQQLIIPYRFVTSKSNKDNLIRTFDIDLEEIEQTVINIKKLYLRRKEKAEHPKTKTVQPEDPQLKAEAEELLKDPNLLDKFITHGDKWLVADETVRKIELLTCISALGDYPLNLALQQVFSSGKTKTIVTVAKYFTDNDVWFLGSMSPRSLIHERGTYNEDTDKFVIDLQNKIIIFLDEPQFETLRMLKPLLSHDRFEIDFKFVQKDTMKTIVSTLKGWPSTVFCAVKSKYSMEFCSRWLTASPQIDIEKIKKVITLKGETAAEPEKYRIDREFKIFKKAFNILKMKAPYKVVIPYAKRLAENYRAKKPSHMRFFDLLLAIIKASTVLHAEQRGKDENKRLVASLEDYETAKTIFQVIERATVFGVGQNVLDFYENIIEPETEAQTYESLMSKHQELYEEPINRNTLRENVLKPLEKAGLIDMATDPQDKRKKVITATTRKPYTSLIDDEGFKQKILL